MSRALQRAAVLLAAAAALGVAQPRAARAQGVLSGTFVLPSSGPVANGTLLLALSQQATSGGGAYLAPSPVSCYTANDGSVTGIPNPATAPSGAAFDGTGTLASGTYYAAIAYTYGGTADTLPSPAGTFVLTAAGEIQIESPGVQPAAASGYAVYMGTAPDALTLQGTVSGFAAYTQSVPLVSGAAPPGSNGSPCKVLFNDQILPTGTYYTATLEDAHGNVLPGFPRHWYLEGGNANVGTLTPLASSPTVLFPDPILATPPNPIVGQSLAGALSMNFYPLKQSGNVGPGFFGLYWAGAMPGLGSTLGSWTPNTAVAVQRMDINAQVAGAGGGNGITLTVSDGTTTCTFANVLPAAAISSSEASSGAPNSCVFHAGMPLSIRVAGDDHTSEPQNLNIGLELTAY